MIWDTDLKDRRKKSSSFLETVVAVLILFVLALYLSIATLDAARKEAQLRQQMTKLHVSGLSLNQEEPHNGIR